MEPIIRFIVAGAQEPPDVEGVGRGVEQDARGGPLMLASLALEANAVEAGAGVGGVGGGEEEHCECAGEQGGCGEEAEKAEAGGERGVGEAVVDVEGGEEEGKEGGH